MTEGEIKILNAVSGLITATTQMAAQMSLLNASVLQLADLICRFPGGRAESVNPQALPSAALGEQFPAAKDVPRDLSPERRRLVATLREEARINGLCGSQEFTDLMNEAANAIEFPAATGINAGGARGGKDGDQTNEVTPTDSHNASFEAASGQPSLENHQLLDSLAKEPTPPQLRNADCELRIESEKKPCTETEHVRFPKGRWL